MLSFIRRAGALLIALTLSSSLNSASADPQDIPAAITPPAIPTPLFYSGVSNPSLVEELLSPTGIASMVKDAKDLICIMGYVTTFKLCMAKVTANFKPDLKNQKIQKCEDIANQAYSGWYDKCIQERKARKGRLTEKDHQKCDDIGMDAFERAMDICDDWYRNDLDGCVDSLSNGLEQCLN